MASEAAVEQEREGRLAAKPGTFRRWIAGVSPNAVLGLAGAFLVAVASGFFLMLDAQFKAQREMTNSQFEAQRELMNSEFKALHGRIDTLEKKLDDSLGKVDRRLLRIEDHLFGGEGSAVKRE